MSDAPSVNPDRIESFFQELAAMQVVLDADPLALGPKRMNAKTAECRALLSRTERIFLEVSQDLYWYRREHRRALADFELAVQDMMANDPEVRAGRNITDRTAVAHTKLRVERERISVLQFACDDLDSVLTVVKTKRNDLKDIASRLRDQLKICQEEIGLGARWSRNKSGAVTKESISKIADSVDNLMDELLAKSGPEPEPEISSESDDDVQEEETPPSSNLDSIFDEVETGSVQPSSQLTSKGTDSESDAYLSNLNPASEITPLKIDINLDEILDMI